MRTLFWEFCSLLLKHCWLGNKSILMCTHIHMQIQHDMMTWEVIKSPRPLSCGPLSLSDCFKSHDPSALLYGDWFTLFFQTSSPRVFTSSPQFNRCPTKHLISEHTTKTHLQSRYACNPILRHFLTPSLSVCLTAVDVIYPSEHTCSTWQVVVLVIRHKCSV